MTSYADILALISASGSTNVDLADDAAVLSLTEAEALSARGVVFASGDTITVKDSAEAIEAVTASEITALKTLGVSEVLANDRALVLDIAQVNAFAAADIAAFSEYATMSATTTSDIAVGSASFASVSAMTPVALADGSYVILYKAPSQLTVQSFDEDGNSTGTVVVATGGTSATGESTISALADGGYVVCWLNSIKTLSVNRYSADGDLVGTSSIAPSVNYIYNASVVGLSDGGFVVTFRQRSSATGSDLMVQRYDADGNAVGDMHSLSSTDYIYSTEDGVVATQTIELADGKIMVVWTDDSGLDGASRGVFGQIIGSDGSTVGSAVALNSSTAGAQSFPSVTELSEGGFAVAWYDEDKNGIYVQVLDDQGNKVNAEISVSTSSYAQDFPKIVALENGNFVVTWAWSGIDDPDATSDGVYSQIIDADGNRVGGISLVNTTVLGNQNAPQIVALTDGGYVIVWSERIDTGSDGYEINGQLFDAEGNKIGGEFEINVTESGDQRYQKITALKDGGFAIAWYDASGQFYTRVYHNDTDIASLRGTASAISVLTAADAADLVEMDIARISVSDGGAVTLTKPAAVALADISGLGIHGATSVTVSGTGASLADLTASEIAKLDAMGVTSVDASNNLLSLSVAQAQAYVSADISLASGDVVTVTLSATELAGLSASELLAFAAIGVDGLDLTGDAASLTLARISEIRNAGFAFADSDVITLADSQMYVSDLTSGDIQDLADWGVTRIDLTEGMSSDPATLSLDQANAYIAAGIVFSATSKVYISASVSDAAALDANDIAALAGLGVDKIIASGTLPISVAQFEAYLDNGVIIDAGIEDVQLVDSAANLEALSASKISHLVDFGIRLLNASNDSLTLDMDQIYALQAVGASVDASDVLALSVSSPTLASLTSDDLNAAVSFGVATVSSSTTLDASLATLARVQTAGLEFDTNLVARLSDTAANLLAASKTDIDAYSALGVDVIRLADTGSVIAGLTVANINALDELGVTRIDVTDGMVSLSLAKATKFADFAIAFESSDTVIITASASTFADPDLLDLAGLRSINVDKIDVTDNALTLSLDQAMIYIDAGIGFTAADLVTVKLGLADAKALTSTAGDTLKAAGVDTIRVDLSPAEAAALTATQITAFGAAGIDVIDIEPDTATLSAAQALALGNTSITFADDDVVSVALTAADLSGLANSAFTAFGAAGLDIVSSTETSLNFSASQLASIKAAGLTLGSGFSAGLVDTAESLLALSSSTIANYTAIGLDTVQMADTGHNLASLSVANIVTLATIGVTTVDVTDTSVSLSLNAAQQFSSSNMVFSANDTVTVTLSGSALSSLDATGIGSFSAIHIDRFDVSDDKVTVSQAMANAVVSADIAFETSDQITMTLSLASALTLTASTVTSLESHGVDHLLIISTPAEIKALTLTQIAALGAVGIDAIDLDPSAVVLSADQIAAFKTAGIDFSDDDQVSQHLAPTLIDDAVSVKETGTAKINVVANDTAHDGLTLSLENAVVSSGKGSVTFNADGTLAVKYTGADLTAKQSAQVVVTYTATDGELTSTANLVVTFTGVDSMPKDIIGTAKADRLVGTAAGELIKGLAGSDALFGKAGDDVIYGGTGNDRITGGIGADDLYGGAGKDTFIFSSTKELATSKKSTDTIFDFSHAEHDKIDIDGIDANTNRKGDQDFTFIGTSAFHKVAGELRFEGNKSAYYVYGDVNGDGKADFVLEVHSATKLVSGDFLL